jgi:hypothetical protein
VRLEQKNPNRIAFYSSQDEVIRGRTKDWPQLARSHDLPWLSHDTDRHAQALTKLILAELREQKWLQLVSG